MTHTTEKPLVSPEEEGVPKNETQLNSPDVKKIPQATSAAKREVLKHELASETSPENDTPAETTDAASEDTQADAKNKAQAVVDTILDTENPDFINQSIDELSDGDGFFMKIIMSILGPILNFLPWFKESESWDKNSKSLENLKTHLVTNEETKAKFGISDVSELTIDKIKPFLKMIRDIDANIDVNEKDFWPKVFWKERLTGSIWEIQSRLNIWDDKKSGTQNAWDIAYTDADRKKAIGVTWSWKASKNLLDSMNAAAQEYTQDVIKEWEASADPIKRLNASILKITKLPANIEYNWRQVPIDILDWGKYISVDGKTYSVYLGSNKTGNSNILDKVYFTWSEFNISYSADILWFKKEWKVDISEYITSALYSILTKWNYINDHIQVNPKKDTTAKLRITQVT